MKLSNLSQRLQSSPVRKFIPYANEAKEKGINVYHLNIGQPDIATPQAFFEAIKDFNIKTVSYSDSNGMLELRKEIAKYYDRFNLGFKYTDIIITNGGSEALQIAISAICDEDDELLVPEPFYTNYNAFTTINRVKIKSVTCNAKENFKLPNKEEFTKIISDKTRAILIANPSNPTGAIYTKEELDTLKEIALEHDLYIISDEVYREFAYDGRQAISMASYAEIEDRVIIIDSISKRFSACGARIGNIASKNKDLMKTLLKFAQSRLCCPTLEQVGAIALYQLDKNYFSDILKEYENRRNTLYNGLTQIDGVTCQKPRGAFYIVVDLPVESAEDFTVFLLQDFSHNNETVMVTPAEGFYNTSGLGKNQVRISYTLEVDKLKRSIELLKLGLEAYKNK